MTRQPSAPLVAARFSRAIMAGRVVAVGSRTDERESVHAHSPQRELRTRTLRNGFWKKILLALRICLLPVFEANAYVFPLEFFAIPSRAITSEPKFTRPRHNPSLGPPSASGDRRQTVDPIAASASVPRLAIARAAPGGGTGVFTLNFVLASVNLDPAPHP